MRIGGWSNHVFTVQYVRGHSDCRNRSLAPGANKHASFQSRRLIETRSWRKRARCQRIWAKKRRSSTVSWNVSSTWSFLWFCGGFCLSWTPFFPLIQSFPFFWLIAINPLSLLCFIIENPKIPHVIMMFFLSQIALQQFSGSNGNNHFTNVTCLEENSHFKACDPLFCSSSWRGGRGGRNSWCYTYI